MEAFLEIPQSAVDIYKGLSEGTRCEVIENVLYMLPSNTVSHQRISRNLLFEINNRVKGKAEVLLPLDTFFEDLQSAFQPDLIVILNENSHIVKNDGLYGPPDVIIEILPDGNKKRDLVLKKAVYEKAGVKEYFVVNQNTGATTCWLLLPGTKYEEQYRNTPGLFKSKVLNIEFEFVYKYYYK